MKINIYTLFILVSMLASCKKNDFLYTYQEALDFKSVSYSNEEIIDVVGKTSGEKYKYLSCAVLVSAGSENIIHCQNGDIVKWVKPGTIKNNAYCYSFKDKDGDILMVVKMKETAGSETAGSEYSTLKPGE